METKKVRYTLIKKYPGSPEIGFSVEFDEGGADPEFTGYPEFWEKVETPLFIDSEGIPVYPGQSWFYLKAETLEIKETNTTEYRGTSKSKVFRFKHWAKARVFQEFLIEIRKKSSVNIANVEFSAWDLYQISISRGESTMEEISNFAAEKLGIVKS